MKIFFSCILLFLSLYSKGQAGILDSLLSTLEDREVENKNDRYLELSRILDSIDEEKIYTEVDDQKRGQELKVSLANGASKLGDYFVSENDLNLAKSYYTRAKLIYEEIDSLFRYAQNIMLLGNINLAQNNHTEALLLYQECLKLSEKHQFTDLTPHLWNNLGLLYNQIGEYDDALNNFSKAYILFIERGDEANSVYALYNKALVQSTLGEDEAAITAYLDLTVYHLKTKNWVSLGSIYNSISEIYLKNKDYELAEEYLNLSLNVMAGRSDSFNSGPSSFYKASIFSNASEVYYARQKIEQAKTYGQEAIEIALTNSYKLDVIKSAKVLGKIHDLEGRLDSALYFHKLYIDFQDSYQNEYDVKQLTKLKMQNQFDAILREKEINRIYQEVTYKNRELTYVGIIIVSLMLVIISVLLYINQKNKNEKLRLKENNLILEKKKLNQDLEYKKKELVTNLMYLVDKNEFIASISKKLIILKPEAKKGNKQIIQQIVNDIRQNYSTETWEEFEIRFKEVHTDFYRSLHLNHPDLTPNEIKICAFLRLNMSTKEISSITHQSISSLNMARFRLRKKLGIDKGESLIAYLNSL